MISPDLTRYWESLVAKRRNAPEESNPHLRGYVTDIRDAWEAGVIVRELRNRAGVATCSGAVDCLENPTSNPTSLCMRGVHQTCPAHTDCCYLCLPRGWFRGLARGGGLSSPA
jgi:hypothetical protein